MKTRENDRCPISCVRGARGREESCRRTRFFFLSFFFSFFFFLFHFDSSTRNLRRFYRSPRIFTIIAIVCKMTLHLSMQELARQIFVAFRGFLSKKKKKKKVASNCHVTEQKHKRGRFSRQRVSNLRPDHWQSQFSKKRCKEILAWQTVAFNWP